MMDEKEIKDRVLQLILEEKAEEADKLLLDAISGSDQMGLLRLRKRTLLLLGDEEGARKVVTSIKSQLNFPTNNEIELSGMAKANVIPLRLSKILYLQIPKCGSTSIKDMLYYILNGQFAENHIHTALTEQVPYKLILRPHMAKVFKDWTRILMVRDPIKRVRSYYRFNIHTASDLTKEFPDRDSFYGLPLRPSYEVFINNFIRYRQVFISLRAHTNSLVALAGRNPDFYSWVGNPSQMEELRELLSEVSGTSIPKIHHFKTGGDKIALPTVQNETKLRDIYAMDYKVFSKYF